MADLASINSTNKTVLTIKDALVSADSAIKKLATGKLSSNPGDHVSETSVARSLDQVVSQNKIGSKTIAEASNMLDATHFVLQGSYDAVLRQHELSMQAASDTIANAEREALNIEFQGLKNQVEDNGRFKYNGISMLDGSFSGQSVLTTLKDKTVTIYSIDKLSQFTSYGKIQENPMLMENSTISASANIGRDYAKGTVDLTGISAPNALGSTISFNGVKFTAVALGNKTGENQFEVVENDDHATVRNLAKELNTTQNSAVNSANYRANAAELDITANQAGFQGNKFMIDAKLIGGQNFVTSLTGGTDSRSHAAVVAQFDAGSNYGESDRVSLNGEMFKFTSSPLLDNEVQIGASLQDSMSNLFNAIRKTDSLANEAFFEFDANTARLTITHNQAGIIGNDYVINLGLNHEDGTENLAKYTLANGSNATSSESLNVTISQVATGEYLGLGKSPISGTQTSSDEISFDQKMIGKFGSISAIFKEGELGNNSDQFTSNKIQFQISLNGDIYQTKDISLAGGNKNGSAANGNGFNGLGNRIAGGTELEFQKIGAKNTDAGFKMVVNQDGFNLNASESIAKVQSELSEKMEQTTHAIKTADIKMGITAPSKAVNDFSLDSIDKFNTSGFLVQGSYLSGKIDLTDTVGTVKAQGVIALSEKAENGDQIIINGTKVIFGDNIATGESAEESRDNLLKHLNQSTDTEISKANYFRGNQNDIIVKYKQDGTSGNEFKIGARFSNGDSVRLNQAYGFSEGTREVSLGETIKEQEKASATLTLNSNTFSGTSLIIGDGVNTKTITFDTDVVVGLDAKETRDALIDFLNSSNDSVLMKANYSASGDYSIAVKFKEGGEYGNQFQINLAANPADPASLPNSEFSITNDNGTVSGETASLTGGDVFIENNTNVIKGKDLQTSNSIITSTLQGRITDISATFQEGKVGNSQDEFFSPNSVHFTANIGGKTYSGDVLLTGGSVDSSNNANGTNYNKLGHLLTPESQISLKSDDGTHSVNLYLDSQGIELSGKTKHEINQQLAVIASKMETDLSNIQINQKREIAGFDSMSTIGTVLNGIKNENVHIQSADFARNGEIGTIGKFQVDNQNNRISVKINGQEHSQILSESNVSGGLGSSYDSTHKVIKGGLDTTLTLKTTSNTNNSTELTINLQGVGNIDIGTDHAAKTLEQALNKAFGVAGDSTGLSFQIGKDESEVVILNFEKATSDAVYLDKNGMSKLDLNISTKEDAQEALKITAEALDRLGKNLATIGSSRGQFGKMVANLEIVGNAMESSSGNLINIDIYEASSEQARAGLQAQAAVSALVHSNNLMKQIASTVMNS